jgi:hypothetical protein
MYVYVHECMYILTYTYTYRKMSGSKRKSPYRKSVTTTYLDSNITLDEGDYIAKVLGSRGASLFELEVIIKTCFYIYMYICIWLPIYFTCIYEYVYVYSYT